MSRWLSSPLLLILYWLVQVRASILEDSLRLALCQSRCPNDGKCIKECDSTSSNDTEIPYLKIPSKSNINLQCKESHRIVLKHESGIYVIETVDDFHNDWMSATISSDHFYESTNLTPMTRYRYRIRKITSQGVSLPEITEWFETHDELYVPKEIKSLGISEITPIKKKPYHLQAHLDIIPADDFNCQYNVIYWGGEHDLYQYQLDAGRDDFSLKLRHLIYERNITVFVISQNQMGSQQSKNVTLSFFTPSCLSVHQNLHACAPAPVTGLRVISWLNKNALDFMIEWEKPELQPDNYTVIVQPTDFENDTVELTISGNETAVDIPKVVLTHRYKIGVLAESNGGTSLKWSLFVNDNIMTVESQVIIGSSTLTTLLLLIVIFASIYIHYNRYKKHSCQYSFFKNINQKACGLDDIKAPSKTLSPYETDENSKMRDKFEIQTDRLTIQTTLGSGISGVVKLAVLKSDKKQTINVAVKMLREDASAEDVRNFHTEIMLMKSVGNHPNIVSIIGSCTLCKQPLLVVEFCSKGDLQTYLRTILEEMTTTIFEQVDWSVESIKVSRASSIAHCLHYQVQPQGNNFSLTVNNRLYDLQEAEKNKISPEDLLNFARQVASGMEFLSSNRIVHRDLAARNVLVCSDQTVKISDFGLSRDIYQENVYKKQTNGKLPIKWMAIEALTHHVYTTYSDVWSFGVLLYEIVTLGGNPYPGLPCSEILHLLKSGYRMDRPSNCGFQLYEVMRSCWHENALNRPTFYNLKQQLDKLLTTVTDNQYFHLSEHLRKPTDHQYFLKHGQTKSSILTIPNIN